MTNLLFDAGKNILDGLINGLKGGFDKVKDTLSGLTDMLPDWKGPAEVDKRILFKSGQLVMGGLRDGLESGEDMIRKHLAGFTADLAGSASVDMSAAGSSTASTAPVDLSDRTLERLSALVADRIMQGAGVALKEADQATGLSLRMG